MADITPETSGDGMTKLARRNIQTIYLDRTLQAIQAMDSSLQNLQGGTDQRPMYLARQCVNRILDDDIRHELLKQFDKKISEISASTTDNEKKSHLIRLASIDVVGEVNSYLDEYLAVHRGQEIGDV